MSFPSLSLTLFTSSKKDQSDSCLLRELQRIFYITIILRMDHNRWFERINNQSIWEDNLWNFWCCSERVRYSPRVAWKPIDYPPCWKAPSRILSSPAWFRWCSLCRGRVSTCRGKWIVWGNTFQKYRVSPTNQSPSFFDRHKYSELPGCASFWSGSENYWRFFHKL